jgi:hypothetical protein
MKKVLSVFIKSHIENNDMQKDKMILIIKQKISQGWDRNRIYNHLLILDDIRKINKEEDFNNTNNIN